MLQSRAVAKRQRGVKPAAKAAVCDGAMVSLTRQALLKHRSYRHRNDVRGGVGGAFQVALPAEATAYALDEGVKMRLERWTTLTGTSDGDPRALLGQFMAANRHLAWERARVAAHLRTVAGQSDPVPPLHADVAVDACMAFREAIDRSVGEPRRIKDERRQAAERRLCADLAALRFVATAARSPSFADDLKHVADNLRRR